MAGPPLFREVQSFRQAWLFLLLLVPLLAVLPLLGGGLYQQLVLGRPFGNNPLSDAGLIAVSALVVAIEALILALFLSAKLITEVFPRRIEIRFIPFHLRPRSYETSDLASHEARTYRPILEYGGWGIRLSLSSGIAYNVSGNRGVQLTLKSGKKILIGSQRAEELDEAIRRAAL